MGDRGWGRCGRRRKERKRGRDSDADRALAASRRGGGLQQHPRGHRVLPAGEGSGGESRGGRGASGGQAHAQGRRTQGDAQDAEGLQEVDALPHDTHHDGPRVRPLRLVIPQDDGHERSHDEHDGP